MNDLKPLGIVADTTSSGRFDLVTYADGVLPVRGTLKGVMIRAGWSGLGYGGSAIGAASSRTYEEKRIATLLLGGRTSAVVSGSAEEFIEWSSVALIALRRRPWEHSIALQFRDDSRRTYAWKPALNNFGQVKDLLSGAYRGPLAVDEGVLGRGRAWLRRKFETWSDLGTRG